MAVAYDAKGTGVGQNFLTGSWSHTVTGANLYMLLVVSMKSPGTTVVQSSSYNSVALAQIASQTQAGNVLTEIWALKAPATGANSLSLTLSGAVDTCAQSFSFTGVDQTTPVTTANIAKTSGAGGNPSLAATGTATGMFLTAAGGDVTASTLTLGTSGGSSRSDQTVAAGNGHLGVASIPGAASITDSWTWNVFVDWTQIIVPLNAVAVPPSTATLILNQGNRW